MCSIHTHAGTGPLVGPPVATNARGSAHTDFSMGEVGESSHPHLTKQHTATSIGSIGLEDGQNAEVRFCLCV